MSTLPSASPATNEPSKTKKVVSGQAENSNRPVQKSLESETKTKKGKKSPADFRKRVLQRLVVGLVLGLVLVSGIIFVSLKLRQQADKLTQKRSALEALSRREESFQELKQAMKVVDKEAILIRRAFLSEPDVSLLLEEISSLEAKHQILVERLAFSDDQPRPDRQANLYIELVFEASGRVDNLQAFVSELVNQPRVIKIKLVDLSFLEEESQHLVFKAWLYTDPEFGVVK